MKLAELRKKAKQGTLGQAAQAEGPYEAKRYKEAAAKLKRDLDAHAFKVPNPLAFDDVADSMARLGKAASGAGESMAYAAEAMGVSVATFAKAVEDAAKAVEVEEAAGRFDKLLKMASAIKVHGKVLEPEPIEGKTVEVTISDSVGVKDKFT